MVLNQQDNFMVWMNITGNNKVNFHIIYANVTGNIFGSFVWTERKIFFKGDI